MPENETQLAPVDAALRSFAIHNRINIYLLDNLAPEVWALTPPGGKGRTISAIVAHIHNVRLMWLKAAKIPGLPEPMEKEATLSESKAAIEASAAIMGSFLQAALTSGRVPNFKPDAWAFAAYLIAHEAHHRGQISLLARQLGHPISKSVNFGMWEWGVR